jgi:hypothetical protein
VSDGCVSVAADRLHVSILDVAGPTTNGCQCASPSALSSTVSHMASGSRQRVAGVGIRRHS